MGTLLPKYASSYICDSNDKDRVQEANEELQKMLREDKLRDATLLVFAKKQDLPNAMSVGSRKWYIQATCATTGDGLYEGLDWLSTALNAKQFKNSIVISLITINFLYIKFFFK